jgi:hypothetical protein
MIDIFKSGSASKRQKWVTGSIIVALLAGLGGSHLWLSSDGFCRAHILPAMAKALGTDVTSTNGNFEFRRGKIVFTVKRARIAWFRTLVLSNCSLRLAGEEAPVTVAEIRVGFAPTSLLNGSPKAEYLGINKAALKVISTNRVANIDPLLEAMRLDMNVGGACKPDLAIKLCEIKDCSFDIERHNGLNGSESYSNAKLTTSSTLTNFTFGSLLTFLNAARSDLNF